MSNKYMNIDDLTEITFYEAMECLMQGGLIECHIEDQDGIVRIWNKYHLEDGIDKGITFAEIIYGKWYWHNSSVMIMDYEEEFDKGED